MPNYVTHRVFVNGPEHELSNFFDTCFKTKIDSFTNQTYLEFDFNTLIPMPEILIDSTSSSDGELGYAILKNQASALERGWVNRLGLQTIEELKTYCETHRPSVLVEGQKYLEAIEQTGYPSWYQWRIAKWGTKWNSGNLDICNYDSEELEFTFTTAWNTPSGIWDAIATAFPNLWFTVYGFDEGWCHAVTGFINSGKNFIKEVEATEYLYEKTYGEPPEVSDDE